MSLKENAEKFSNDKKALNPFWKPETNIPADVRLIKVLPAAPEKNQSGEEYAVLPLRVEIEIDGEPTIKMWNVTSEKLSDALIEKGVDDGSTFTVLKKGEGISTKYEISNVVNKEKVSAPVAQGTTTAPAPTNNVPTNGPGPSAGGQASD